MILPFSPLNMTRQLAFIINLAAMDPVLPVKEARSATLDALVRHAGVPHYDRLAVEVGVLSPKNFQIIELIHQRDYFRS